MSRVVILLLGLLCTMGCATPRHLTTANSDSLRVEVVRREVVVHDTVLISLPAVEERQTVRCDTSLLVNDYARSEARIMPDGELFHSLASLPKPIVHPVSMAVELRDSIVYRERLVREVVEVERELTAWQQFSIYGFYLLLLVFVARRV